MTFVMATANPDKVAEITAILEGFPIHLVARPATLGDTPETGTTLEDNARVKAMAVFESTGEPCLADDTGLEVDALGGAPGVFSSRYAANYPGEKVTYADNVAKLLLVMEGVTNRRARFRTVAVACLPAGDASTGSMSTVTEVLADGILEGEIAVGPKGNNGFGYDPVFIPDGYDGLSLAEMTTTSKNLCSHRGKAFRQLVSILLKDHENFFQ
ncbi:MAG: RdgB/HAM1 family non-canonical purine NTP pyrophosphatase [Actinobacteria bacterium]|nr:RdgB/HAM1 family non-canonical purine NTP pyrophosphatase [Actinomycetota bacterium]